MGYQKSLNTSRVENLQLPPEQYLPEVARGQVFKTRPYNPDFEPEVFIRDVESGKIVVAAAFREFGIRSRGVEVYDDKQIDGRRSAHGVRFGSMHYDDGMFVTVALKPFVSARDALNELDGYERLASLAVPTFSAIGIFPALYGDHYISMTAKNDGLISLDRAPWVSKVAIRSSRDMKIAEINDSQVTGISRVLALIHANGMFHPDGQIKNYASTNAGKIGVIDTESMQVREIGDQDCVELAWNDIDKLVKSLIVTADAEGEEKIFGVGMLAHLSFQDVREHVKRLIIEPYQEQLLEMMSTEDVVTQRQLTMLFDGIVECFDRDSQWPKHIIDINPPMIRD